MISVALFKTFAKDHNSTMQPVHGTGAVGYPYQCDIYDPCSIISPVLIIRQPNTMLQEQGYNYAHIPTWRRYYWITDMVFQEGAWYVHLQVDVLASFKTEIGASTQYVLRSAAEYDTEITDTAYTPTGPRIESMSSEGSTPFATTIAGGTFVLGITTGNASNTGNSTLGTTTYIALTPAQMEQLITVLWGTGDYLNLLNTDLETDVAKLIINPLQYIQSCKWIPQTVPYTVSIQNIQFAWWPVQVSGVYALSASPKRRVAFHLELPPHPQAATMGGYLNRPPYSQYTVELPVIGELELPGERIQNDMPYYILIDYQIDLITGIAELTISQTDSLGPGPYGRDVQLLYTTCNMAVDVPLAQIVTDKVGALTSAAGGMAGGIASILSGNIMQGISSMVTGAIDATVKYTQPIPSFMGGSGNLSLLGKIPKIHNYHQNITPPAFELLGRPLCQMKQLSTLPGFIMCARAHVAIAGAMAQEVEQIENFLNTGFYYE